jgi:t-SNARE complex subunit (syntaxin)
MVFVTNDDVWFKVKPDATTEEIEAVIQSGQDGEIMKQAILQVSSA